MPGNYERDALFNLKSLPKNFERKIHPALLICSDYSLFGTIYLQKLISSIETDHYGGKGMMILLTV